MTDYAAPLKRDRTSFAVALILVSTICTATQDATFKFASSDMSLWQIFTVRSFFLIPALAAIAVLFRVTRVWPAAFQPWSLARAVMFLLMYLSMFSVMPFLELAVVAAGLYTGPLWVAVFSPILLREPITLRSAAAIALGFGGVLVNLRPGTDAFTWATIFPVLAGAFYALSAIITRSKCRELPPIALSLSLAVVLLVTGALGSLVILLIEPTREVLAISAFLFNQWAPMGQGEWIVIAVLTVVIVVNSIVLPTAYQAGRTVVVATFDYFYLIWSPLIGYFLFSEIPDFYTILAMVMIAGAGLMILKSAD